MLRTRLYNALSAFTEVKTLILGSGSGGWFTEAYSDKFLLGLHHMPNLVHFSLKYDCTASVLQVLSETCPHTLKILDIERSRQVHDNAIQYILRLDKVVSLNIFQLDISTEGYVRFYAISHKKSVINGYFMQAKILTQMPHLAHLERGDFLVDVIDHLQETGSSQKIMVQEFWASEEYYFHTEQQMTLVSMYCPHITSMLFMFDVSHSRLQVLAKFTKLQKLDLWGGAFYEDGLCELLEHVGHQLVKLSLVHIEELDEKALAILTVTCPNLKSLGLHNCDLIDINPQDVDENSPFR